MKLVIQANLDLRNSSFPFSNLELFDLRKNYVVNLKTGRPKKCLIKVGLVTFYFRLDEKSQSGCQHVELGISCSELVIQ